MKTIYTIIAIILLSFTQSFAITKGDINDDGIISAIEAIYALQVSSGINYTDVDNDNDSYSEEDGDCNDANANINPGAEEICGDSIDQDCNGRICYVTNYLFLKLRV